MSGESGDLPLGERLRERTRDLSRRDLLKGLAGLGGVYGVGKTLDNVVLGYGIVQGTNLVDQDLAALAAERLAVHPTRFTRAGIQIGVSQGAFSYWDDAGQHQYLLAETTPAEAADLDAELGLPGTLEALVRDLTDLREGNYRFAFSNYEAFYERVRAGDHRPATVAALRGDVFDPPSTDLVGRVTDADPTDTEAVTEGLVGAFRECSGYDTPQYVAGAVQDNVIFDAVDLRAPLDDPVDWDAIVGDTDSGLFCFDFAHRSVEALHATAPAEQDAPVAGAVVTDPRHKHVYTGVASAVREDGDLILPMTFVDYMHSTLNDDFHVRGLLGEGLAAYDRRHRAHRIFWNHYAYV